MYSSMLNKIIFLQERFATLFAGKLLRPVVVFFVPGQNVTVGEGGVTDVAGEGALPCVGSYVVTELTWF